MEFIFIFACAVIINFSNEITARQGTDVFKWITENFIYFALNLLIHAAFLLIFTGAAGSFLFAGITCSLIFFGLANVSFFKYAARNEVLYASDFLLFFKVMSVSDKSNLFITRYNIISLVLDVLCMLTAAFFPISTPDAAHRLVLSGIGLAAAILSFLYIRHNKQNDFTYFTKGFTLGLLSNLYLYFSESFSEPLLEGEKTASVYEPKRVSEVKPNVIVVLSESFWDIEKIPGLRFSEKVAPNFRRLAGSHTHGSLIVTPFGGGTCNVESEILTGAPIRYFNISNSFYHRYITHSILSLPEIFNKNGYETTALHTFDKDFYNRDTALSYMGVGSFKAKEDLIDPVYEGTYIADSELTKMIINAFEKKSKPSFIMGISMENHQPYSKGKYGNNPIQLLNDDIDPMLKGIAETYAHGIHDADRELAALIRYFEQVKEPTDIIFFGDHLGALGPLFALYRKMGFISAQKKLSPQDIKNLYSTEFVIWSNYKTGKSVFSDTSSNFLGNIILNHIGFEKPEMYYFMDEVYKKWHGVNRLDLLIDSGGKMYSGGIPEDFHMLDEQYRHLARRLILG